MNKPMTTEEMADRCDEWAQGMPNDADLAAEFTAIARRIRLLGAEVKAARECVEPDPIYGWDEPRHLSDDEPAWAHLGAARAALDADERGEVANG